LGWPEPDGCHELQTRSFSGWLPFLGWIVGFSDECRLLGWIVGVIAHRGEQALDALGVTFDRIAGVDWRHRCAGTPSGDRGA